MLETSKPYWLTSTPSSHAGDQQISNQQIILVHQHTQISCWGPINQQPAIHTDSPTIHTGPSAHPHRKLETSKPANNTGSPAHPHLMLGTGKSATSNPYWSTSTPTSHACPLSQETIKQVSLYSEENVHVYILHWGSWSLFHGTRDRR